MNQKLEELKKRYNCSSDEMNYMVYDPADTPMDQILADAMTPPFLTDYKMVVLTNPLFLTGTRQKDVSKADIDAFTKYIDSDNPSTVFIVFYEGNKFDERKKAVKSLRQHAQFFEMDRLTFQQLYKTTRQSIIHRGCTIDDDALNLLISRVGDNLYDIANQVEKLCLYSKHIKVEDVDRLVAKPVEENVFALTNAILSHDMNKTMSIYRDLMATNHEPIALIGLIANSLRNLYEVKFLTRKGYNDREIAKMTGINPRAIYPIRKNGTRFDTNELLEKLDELSQLDVKIKTGLIDKERGLELFLVNLG